MGRTTVEFKLNNDIDTTMDTIIRILSKYGYENKLVKGENVWVKENSVTPLSLRCFAFYFGETSVVLQGWMFDEIFGEQELKGFAGMVVKNKMKAIMKEIEQAI